MSEAPANSPRHRRIGFLALLPPLILCVLILATPGSATARIAGTLTMSPTSFYGGQGVTFTGTLGSPGTREIWLEYNMNRPGDTWTRIPGFSTRTAADGSFAFTQPARAMTNISLRVASKGFATPGVNSNAWDQEVALSIALNDSVLDLLGGSDLHEDHLWYTALVGAPFVLTVDTSPSGGPILPGRKVTLQRQIGSDEWQSIATGVVNAQGLTHFVQVVTTPSTVVYRARLEAWTDGGSKIGWFPSFPTTVEAMNLTQLLGALREDPDPVSTEGLPTPTRSTAQPAVTAARTFEWWPVRFDFDWEYGESLTDKPSRGTRSTGTWVDESTGSGRVAHHNAGLMLESKYGRVVASDAGAGDHGTVSATLHGNAQTYGRWEVRIRPWVIESAGEDYHVRFELVPEDPAQRACGARSITVADLNPRFPVVRYGVTTPNRNKAWRGTRDSTPLQQVARAYAVEVARDHISWFVDGKIIGTVRARAAVPRVPLTIRLSLVGEQQAEMNHTYAIMDWIRGYPLKHGQRPTNGARLTPGTHDLGC